MLSESYMVEKQQRSQNSVHRFLKRTTLKEFIIVQQLDKILKLITFGWDVIKFAIECQNLCEALDSILPGLLNTLQTRGGVFYPLLIRLFFILEA